MPDDRRQDEDGGFRKIFAIIAAVHLVVLGLILLLSFQPLKPQTETLVWMAAGSFEDVAAGHDQNAASSGGLAPAESSDRTVEETDQTMEEQTPPPPPATPPQPSPAQLSTPQPTLPPVDDKPDLPLATPTPSPSATPTPKPTPHVMPEPTPAATPTPRPSVKPTPKPTARPTPKPTAKPSPKPSALSKPKSETSASPEEDTGDKKHAKPQGSPSPKFETGGSSKGKAPPTEVLNGSGNPRTGANKGASQGSAASDSTLAYYAEVIKNRFQAAWNQPHGEIAPGTELVATVKLKIQPDGTVTEFTLVDGSGNPVVDDSVREAGRKITKLPPPPDGTTFSPVVRFELGD